MDTRQWHKLPSELCSQCWEFGQAMVVHYAGGGSPRSRAVSSHGAESNPVLHAESKVAECVAAMHFELFPGVALKWVANNADRGWDLIVARTRVDVKQVSCGKRYLLWPIKKNEFFDDKEFDVLMLVETETSMIAGNPVGSARGFVAGWISKRRFRREREVAGDGHALDPGTRYIEKSKLQRVGVFPGRSDDPREHYCWCGEPGWLGYPGGRWFCPAHKAEGEALL